MPAELFTPEQERTLRRVLRLVDISRDLDRNRADTEFVAQGGEIIRVLDENIFEMFFRPRRHAQTVETFYADVWAPNGKRMDSWRSFEAQAALLTAEFLLGRSRRHNAEVPIYMTEYHRFELANRVESLGAELKQAADGQRKDVRAKLALKLAVMSDLERGRIERAIDFARDLEQGDLGSDLQALGPEAPDDVVQRVRASRVAAAFLANDELVEPLDQLRRAVSPPIRSALRSIQTLFPAGSRERAMIEADAERWYERLAAELGMPGHRGRTRAERERRRHPGGRQTPETREKHIESEQQALDLRNDARSLAYLRWVVRNRLEPHQRLVFISGDAVVFDAYRRWYLGESHRAPDEREPFFLRRATQYTPIFNPQETGGDLSSSAASFSEQTLLFTLIQQAVEAALLPLSMALGYSGSMQGDGSFHTFRERLALKLTDRESIADDPELVTLLDGLTPDWIAGRKSEMSKIRANWQRAHRLSIGASIDLITLRLGKELRAAAADYFSATSRDASPILSRYITEVLDQLVDDSIQLWMPLAESFEVESFDRMGIGGLAAKRITVALSLPDRPPASGNGSSPETAGSRAPDASSGESWSPETTEAAEQVFARAACRAVENQDVLNATRFAGLARRADRVARTRGTQIDGFDLDLQYLHAVALRMQIANIGLHLRGSRSEKRRATMVRRGAELVKNAYTQAITLLDRCLAEHATDMDDSRGTALEQATILYLRALSERASLNLFTATSFGLAAKAGPALLLDDYASYLEIARQDLRRCVRVDQDLPDGDPTLALVRAQFIPNIAAYDVLACILVGDAGFKLQEWPRRTVRRLWDFWKSSKHVHPLLEAELLAYAGLIRETPPQGGRSHREHRSLRLPLDRLLYHTILREFPAVPATRRVFRTHP